LEVSCMSRNPKEHTKTDGCQQTMGVDSTSNGFGATWCYGVTGVVL
jgi:hypothetical protein